jgi:3-oxoacyl-[acyl-carrier protein] reductase
MTRVALVTGGSYGIGKGCAVALARSRNNIVILSRKEGEGRRTVRGLEKLGIRAVHLPTDMAVKEQIIASIRQTLEIFGRIDIVVNNAGTASPLKYFFKQTDEEWDEILKVNLYGTYYLMKEVAPVMIGQRYGRVINISSTAANTASCGRGNYVAAKAGIEGLSMTAAKELAKYRITVNVVRPGYTVTPLLKSRGYNLDKLKKEVPCQRLAAPEDVARLVSFLADEKSGLITGQVISVDGGWTLAGEGISSEWMRVEHRPAGSGTFS